jgi:site-specific DNA recombinase
MKNQTPDVSARPAVIYARYSSHRQSEVSIEQQVDECRAYAARNGLSVSRVYADRQISGRTDRRPEFQRMMRDAEKRDFRTVVSYKSNRVARNMLHALMYEEKLSKLGIDVVYVKEEFGNNAAGRFALRMMMNMNQFYSENMAEDIKRGMYSGAKDGLVVSSIPLGYRKGEDGKFALDPQGAETVREIFARVASGATYAEIAADLNARRIRTSRGKPWQKTSFSIILSNEAYVGVYHFGSVRIEGGMPAILSKEEFDKVQEEVRNRRARNQPNRWQKSDFLLTGKLFCGHCLSTMIGSSGTSRNGAKHHYYACQKRNASASCDKKNIRRNAAERLVANAICEYILTPETIAWIADNAMLHANEMQAQSAVKQVEAELAEIRKQLANLVNAAAQGIFNSTTQEKMLSLEAELKDAEERLALEKRMLPTVTRENVVAWLEGFRSRSHDDPAFKKELFDTFLEAAYLYDDRLRLVFNYTGETNEAVFPLHGLMSDPPPGDPPPGSYSVHLGPPKRSEANHRAAILYLIRGKFVLDIQLKEEDLL